MASLCKAGPSRLARAPHPPPITSPHLLRPFSTTPPSSSHIGARPVPIPSDVNLFLSRGQAVKSGSLKDTMQLVVKGPLGQLKVNLEPYLKMGWKGTQATTEGQAKAAAHGVAMPMEELFAKALLDSAPSASNPTPGEPLLPIRLPGSKEDVVTLGISSDTGKKEAAMWGLTRALLANAVEGVSKGFTATVRLVGVTYRAELENAPVPSTAAPAPTTPPTSPAKRLNLKLGFSHPVYVDLPTTPTFLGVEVQSPTQIVLKSVDKREVGQLAANIRKFRKPEPYNGKGVFVNDETIKRKEVKKR